MITNKDKIKQANTTMSNAFAKGGASVEPQWPKIAMKVTSTGARNTYHWLSKWPKLHRWVGAKVVNNLSAHAYTVENEDFEATVSIPKNDMEDGLATLFEPAMRQAALESKLLPDELVFEVARQAFQRPCFDGRPFIDDAHPVGDKVVSNKGNMKLSADSLAAADASIGVARTTMRKFKDSQGSSLNVTPSLLMVGPDLENTARNLLTLDKFVDGTPNPYKDSLELLVSNHLDSPTEWFLLDTTKEVKPFVFQPRKEPVLTTISEESDFAFMDKELLYSIEARAAAAFGFWHLAYGSTGKG